MIKLYKCQRQCIHNPRHPNLPLQPPPSPLPLAATANALAGALSHLSPGEPKKSLDLPLDLIRSFCYLCFFRLIPSQVSSWQIELLDYYIFVLLVLSFQFLFLVFMLFCQYVPPLDFKFIICNFQIFYSPLDFQL